MGAGIQGAMLAMVGAVSLAIGVTDVHLRYVKASMRWPLIVAGLLILLVGLIDQARDSESEREAAEPEHGTPSAAWLLFLPVLVMGFVTPGALGSFSAERQPSRPQQLVDGFLPLDQDRNGAVDLSLNEFSSRVAYAPATLQDRRVRMIGFVIPQAGGWSIARLQVSCCAADGQPIKVRVEGSLAAAGVPARDSWVMVIGTATGMLDGRGAEVTAGLALEELVPVEAPADSYE